jgi:hypothetical protein
MYCTAEESFWQGDSNKLYQTQATTTDTNNATATATKTGIRVNILALVIEETFYQWIRLTPHHWSPDPKSSRSVSIYSSNPSERNQSTSSASERPQMDSAKSPELPKHCPPHNRHKSSMRCPEQVKACAPLPATRGHTIDLSVFASCLAPVY